MSYENSDKTSLALWSVNDSGWRRKQKRKEQLPTRLKILKTRWLASDCWPPLRTCGDDPSTCDPRAVKRGAGISGTFRADGIFLRHTPETRLGMPPWNNSPQSVRIRSSWNPCSRSIIDSEEALTHLNCLLQTDQGCYASVEASLNQVDYPGLGAIANRYFCSH